MSDRAPSIVPIEFRIEYLPNPDGTMREIEIVEYTRKGSQGATTPARIEHLKRQKPGSDPDPLWMALKPYYENWKTGREAPVDGTPLAAWPGATPQLVKALVPYHIRSIEDLANLTDGVMAKVPVPGIAGFRANAKAYVAAVTSTAPIAGKLAEQEKIITTQSREIAELKELVTSLAADKGIEITTDKPKRGRPKKAA